jgi:hypothetical protein
LQEFCVLIVDKIKKGFAFQRTAYDHVGVSMRDKEDSTDSAEASRCFFSVGLMLTHLHAIRQPDVYGSQE